MESVESYEPPQVTVLGEVAEFTQKHGIYFDYGHATQGSPTYPGPTGAGVSYS